MGKIYGAYILRDHFTSKGVRELHKIPGDPDYDHGPLGRASPSIGRILVEAPNADAAIRLIKGVYLLNEKFYLPKRTSKKHPHDEIRVIDLACGKTLAKETGFSLERLERLVLD